MRLPKLGKVIREGFAITRPVPREVMPIKCDYVQETQAFPDSHQRRIGQVHPVVLGGQSPHVLHVSRVQVCDQQLAIQDHAEQLFNTTTIVFIKQIGDLGYHRPGGYQQSRIGSGESHSPRMIRISRVDQGEKRAGVSENVSRQ